MTQQLRVLSLRVVTIEAGIIRPTWRDFSLIALHATRTCGAVEFCLVVLGFGFWVTAA